MTADGTTRQAATPPMGWNSWNEFHLDIDEAVIRDNADALVASGLADAGYEYVVVDGGWRSPERDSRGNMRVNDRFPGGIKAVAEHVHSLGLKLGLHQAVGERDCAGRTPGTQSAPDKCWRDKARRDLDLFLSWGVDLLKFDLCRYQFPEGATQPERDALARAAYVAMGEAIAESGHPVVYSVSEYGRHRPWSWADEAGANMWRTTRDLRNRWRTADTPGFSTIGVVDVLELHEPVVQHSRPGSWADPDMLVVGVRSAPMEGEAPLTFAQNRAHLSLWAILAAPLMISHDLRTADPDVHSLVANREVLAVDQDPLGVPGRRVRQVGDTDVWVRPLAGGDAAVVVFNRGDREAAAEWRTEDVGMVAGVLRDLWTGREEPARGRISTVVGPQDAAMYRLTPHVEGQ